MPASAEAPRLIRDDLGLALAQGDVVVRGDFNRMRPRLKPANLARELVVRSAKVKSQTDEPLAVDATAGLGEDSFLLAAAGFRVLMFERNEIVAALLQDALVRAAGEPDLTDIVARMQLVEGDSVSALARLDEAPDVVLLDPMFPEKKKNAAVKKKLQLLQQLERPCEDEAALLEAACSALPRKIVVKRPAKGPYLAGRKPSYSLAGKAVRYDCIVLR